MMQDPRIQVLLDDLKSPDPQVRDRATQKLWEIWFQQKGVYGYQLLTQSQLCLEAGNFEQAELLLSEITLDQPDFAEAWNRRAVLYYLQQRYEEAIADCRKVIQLIPVHFGALHGLGLCYLALENYQEAIAAFRKAAEVQPYSLDNQRLILECTAKMS